MIFDTLLIISFTMFGTAEYKDQQHKPTKEIQKPKVIKEVKGCKTEITKIYDSKKHGKITTCQGRLLTEGQATRIIYEKAK